MTVLHANELEYSVGRFPLLDKASFTIEEKERVALIGRNGQGKSTLFKILMNERVADRGVIEKATHIDIAMLSQTLLPANEQTVFEAVALGLRDVGQLLNEYHDLTNQLASAKDIQPLLDRMSELQQHIDRVDGWRSQQRIERVITELNLPADSPMSSLSGGWRRRVALAQVFVREPDLLLLDEPTNHLDIEAIQWLEKALLSYPKSLFFITHDRALIRTLATRILELDRGNITSYPGNYETYVERKEKFLEDERRHNALFDKKLAEEEAWLRQGVKARRTRNEGRVKNLEQLRLIRQERREQAKDPNFKIHTSAGTSKVVIEAKNISFAYHADKPIIAPFSITIQKGDKIALVGPNGAGKTTLINLLIGNLKPTTGEVKYSANNQLAFYDQHRMQIDPEKTLVDNVAEGSDMIEMNGQSKHIIGYLSDFLFSPEKARSKAKALSGGETNRLLLAKIFAKPANLLVLDEPTNDLDVESLEMLESLLYAYPGTVIVISHDREFIDNIATHTIVFEGNGKLKTYYGGYSDWLSQSKEPQIEHTVKPKIIPAPEKPKHKSSDRELKTLTQHIEKLEAQMATLHAKMAQPNFYQQDEKTVKSTVDELKKLEQALVQAYQRWEELE